MMADWCVRAGTLLLVLLLLVAVALADKPPTVYVYTRNPIEFGVQNQLICHSDSFHPPRISISLRKDKVKYENCVESDLSFHKDWTYHKTVHVPFTPKEGETYECEVNHNEAGPKVYQLEALL
ncbi:beta-2-microglobulin [Pseudophryne corroboree]|uniref:beta-2-microglobulin n=1 Tax=Pseudophryne corroboree TaxID=495146 RepID=UPI003081C92C